MEETHIPTPEERREQRMEQQNQAGAGRGNAIMRAIFGIIMIIVYIGMGVLLIINFFDWGGDWAWTRYVVGIVLIIYGAWRAYRQFAGIDSRI